MVELRGLEPLTSTLPVLRTSHLYYSPEHAYEDTTFLSDRQGGILLNSSKAARPDAKKLRLRFPFGRAHLQKSKARGPNKPHALLWWS